jgi:hypothetical protein
MQLYLIKFLSHLGHVGWFFWVVRFGYPTTIWSLPRRSLFWALDCNIIYIIYQQKHYYDLTDLSVYIRITQIPYSFVSMFTHCLLPHTVFLLYNPGLLSHNAPHSLYIISFCIISLFVFLACRGIFQIIKGFKTITTEKWTNFCNHVENKIEPQYWKSDHIGFFHIIHFFFILPSKGIFLSLSHFCISPFLVADVGALVPSFITLKLMM